MPLPAVQTPLGGNLGAYTASFFRLDPATFTVPLEPLPDIVPSAWSPLRVTLDVVDQESMTLTYDVTEHPVQTFLDVQTNKRRRLRGMTISGAFGATPPLLPLIGAVAPSPSFVRLDMVRLKILQDLADLEEPIMVVTPRHSMHRAFITSIDDVWTPGDGEQMHVTISLREARLVGSLAAEFVTPDWPAQSAGNNAATGGGQSPGVGVPSTGAPPYSPGRAPGL